MAKQTKSKKKMQGKRPASSIKSVKTRVVTSRREQFMQRIRMFLVRRPHRSFRRTRRRDYARSLSLPGYIAFTKQVLSHLWMYRRVFGGLVIIYAIATVALVGIASQSDFKELSGILNESNAGVLQGGWGEVGKAAILLASGVSDGFSVTLDETQQVFAAFLFLMTWLTSVWLIRAQMAGNAPRLRDALYNSGAPIISTIVVGLFLLLQMIPAVVGIVLYGTALATDFFSTGAIAMVVGVVAFLLIVLSLYFLTSGFFALVIVTLPGMYPWQAVRTAGDLVTGRRLRILLRLTWAALWIAVGWIAVMLPVVLFGNWLQSVAGQLEWIPIIPVALTLISSASAVFMSAYVYMLYRKVVDDASSPA